MKRTGFNEWILSTFPSIDYDVDVEKLSIDSDIPVTFSKYKAWFVGFSKPKNHKVIR